MANHPFSIWSSFDIDLSPEDMVMAVESRGLSVCELSDEHGAMLLSRKGTPESIGKAFGEFAVAHGVSFPQGHLWLKAKLCDKSVDAVGILKKWIVLFSAIGIKNAVLHCDGTVYYEGETPEEILENNVRALKELVPTAEERGVIICLENLRTSFTDVSDLLTVIEKVGSDSLGICLDTGHLNLTHPGTQEEFILAAGKRLHALHIADNQGKLDRHMMPFGRGNVDFASVMRGLKAIGYTGLFNYEIPGEKCLPQVLRKAKAEYLQKVTDYLFSL